MEKNIGGGYFYTEDGSSASYDDEGFSVESLSDVDISNPTNGQTLVYNATTKKWENGAGGGTGSSALSGLTDVDISNPTNGQTLVYNATSGKWENGDGGGGGLFIVGFSLDMESGRYTCDKTAQQIAQAIMGGSAVVLENTNAEHQGCTLRQILLFDYDNYDPEDFYASMLTMSGLGNVVTWTINSADSYPFTQTPV